MTNEKLASSFLNIYRIRDLSRAVYTTHLPIRHSCHLSNFSRETSKVSGKRLVFASN